MIKGKIRIKNARSRPKAVNGYLVEAHVASPPEASRVTVGFHLYACCRHYPGRTSWTKSLNKSNSHRPSPLFKRIGFCITLFEACSTFTHARGLRTRQVAQGDPLHRSAFNEELRFSLLRLLPTGAISCRVKFAPT